MPDLDTFTRHEKLKAAARIWSTNAGHQHGTHRQLEQEPEATRPRRLVIAAWITEAITRREELGWDQHDTAILGTNYEPHATLNLTAVKQTDWVPGWDEGEHADAFLIWLHPGTAW